MCVVFVAFVVFAVSRLLFGGGIVLCLFVCCKRSELAVAT